MHKKSAKVGIRRRLGGIRGVFEKKVLVNAAAVAGKRGVIGRERRMRGGLSICLARGRLRLKAAEFGVWVSTRRLPPV